MTLCNHNHAESALFRMKEGAQQYFYFFNIFLVSLQPALCIRMK